MESTCDRSAGRTTRLAAGRRFTMLVLIAASWVTCPALVRGQSDAPPPPVQPGKLAFTIQDLIAQHLTSVPVELRPIVAAAINPSFASLNTSIATQLSNLPVSSPASATRYRFDRQLGVYVPSAQSLGPILSERAETIGDGKFFFALTYQRFQFDRLDDLDLRGFAIDIPVQIPPAGGLPGGLGTATTNTYVGLSVNQTTGYFTYGITHWLDASLAIPIVQSTFTIRSQAGLTLPSLGVTLSLPVQTIQASSTGLGDQTIRVKATLPWQRQLRLAVATDLRLPSGDEFNFHGAGAYGVKGFAIASLDAGRVSPHANVGFEWNGHSNLGSDEGQGAQKIPNRISSVFGFDAALSHAFTVAVDLSDQFVIDGQRTRLVQGTTPNGASMQTVAFEQDSRHEVNAAAGFKAQIKADLVITGNILFRLNDAGLRSRVVPNFGISYLF